jgi:hypothetical protein
MGRNHVWDYSRPLKFNKRNCLNERPKTYAGQCRTMSLILKDRPSGRTAALVFK